MGLSETKLEESGESCTMLSYMHCIIRGDIIINFEMRRMSWAGHVARMELSRTAYDSGKT